jgi:hypothetical protein
MNKKTYLEKYQKIVDLIEKEFPQDDKCKMVHNVQYSHDWHDCTIMKGHTNQRFELRIFGEVDTKEDVKPLPEPNIGYWDFVRLLSKNGILPTDKKVPDGYNNRRPGVVGDHYSNGDNVEMVVFPSIFGETDSVTLFCNSTGYQPQGVILQSNDVEFEIMRLVRTMNKNNWRSAPTQLQLYANTNLKPFIKEKAQELNLRPFVNKLISLLKERDLSKDDLETMVYIFLISQQEYLASFIQLLDAYPNPWSFVGVLNNWC